MALKPGETRDLKRSYKRLLWFILGVLLVDAFIAFLIFRANPRFNPVLCGFIIICITSVLYLIYLWICAKIDKKKKEKLEKSGKTDPFSRK